MRTERGRGPPNWMGRRLGVYCRRVHTVLGNVLPMSILWTIVHSYRGFHHEKSEGIAQSAMLDWPEIRTTHVSSTALIIRLTMTSR